MNEPEALRFPGERLSPRRTGSLTRGRPSGLSSEINKDQTGGSILDRMAASKCAVEDYRIR